MLPLDTSLPGLQSAFDTARVSDELSAILQRQGAPYVEFRDCALVRFRYRPGARAIFLYELQLANAGKNQPPSMWACGTLFRGDKSERILSRLASTAKCNVAVRPQHSCAYIPTIGMLVELFPFDRHLPQLARFVQDPPADLLQIFVGAFGGDEWRLADIDMTPIRYRPGIAAVLRYTIKARLRDGQSARKVFYVKLQRDRGVAHSDATSQSDNPNRRAGCGLRLNEVIARLPKYGAIVHAAAPGHSFVDLLKRSQPIAGPERLVAEALAELHTSGIEFQQKSARVHVAASAIGTAELIGGLLPCFGTRARTLADKIARGITDEHCAPVHLDMKPEHAFVDGEGVTFIDLESAGFSHPMLDAGCMIARLMAAEHLYGCTRSQADEALQAFVRAYLDVVPGDWCREIGPAIASEVFRIARYFAEHQVLDWPDLVGMQIRSAEDMIKGGSVAIRRSPIV